MSKLANLTVIETPVLEPKDTPVATAVVTHEGLASLFTVDTLVASHPNLFPHGKATLNWWLRQRNQNGFAACVLGTGKNLLIDANEVYKWLTTNRP